MTTERFRYYIGRLLVRIMGFKHGVSYSSLNEDLVLDWLTGNKERGTYIDIGAHQPDEINNTKLFYQRGWRGINIEPDTKAYELFLKSRPEDINLNEAIGEGQLVYYGNEEVAGNTFNPEQAKKEGLKPIKSMRLTPLRDIFERYSLTKVDFISIDVEKFEEQALRTNDWGRYTADVICLEGFSHTYLKKWGYKKVFYDGGNSYYKLKGSKIS